MRQMRALLYLLNMGIYRYVGDRSDWECIRRFTGGRGLIFT